MSLTVTERPHTSKYSRIQKDMLAAGPTPQSSVTCTVRVILVPILSVVGNYFLQYLVLNGLLNIESLIQCKQIPLEPTPFPNDNVVNLNSSDRFRYDK